MASKQVVIAGIGLVAAMGLAWWLQRPAGAGGAAAQPGAVASAPAGAGGTSRAGAGGPAAVEVAQVTVGGVEDDATAVGTTQATRGVMLRPEVSGRVKALGFQDGQAVRAGQWLVQLDDALQQAQLQQAQAQARIARTNLQRSRELLAQNFVSPSAVDQNDAALQVAEAQVALAEAQVQRMRIVAPFDGVVGIAQIHVGDYLKDGADLVSLDAVRQLHLDFQLPERLAVRVQRGLPVEARFDALPGTSLQARVLQVDTQVDPTARALRVRAQLDNPGGQIKPGMFARVRVVLSRSPNAVLVPEEALMPLGGKQYVFRVRSAEADAAASAASAGPGTGWVAERLEARLGARADGKVEILEGLSAGDRVVTAGQARLQRGDRLPVRIVDLARAGQARPAASAASGA